MNRTASCVRTLLDNLSSNFTNVETALHVLSTQMGLEKPRGWLQGVRLVGRKAPVSERRPSTVLLSQRLTSLRRAV